MPAASSARVSMPGGLRPMLVSAAPLPPDNGNWAFEVKWDGLRALALIEEGRVRLRSRHGHDLSAAFPELTAPAAPPCSSGAVLDGEVVVLDPASGRPAFERAQRRLGCAEVRAAQLARTEPATFIAFDLLWADGRTLVDHPYRQRRAALEALDLCGARWHVTPAFPSGAALWTATARQGLEGVVAKRLGSRYRPGRRSRDWVKATHWQRATLPVVGWRGRGDRVGALLLARPEEDGTLRLAATVERGLAPALRVALAAALTEVSRTDCRLADPPAGEDIHWVEPWLAARVRFHTWTSDGLLRHPLVEAVELADR